MLRIRARYYRLYSDARPYGCSEKDFHYVEQELAISPREAALILVDCWNIHYCESYLSRARSIIEQNIVSAAQAAREAGLTVIHAPSSNVARKYPQHLKYFEAEDEESSPRYAFIDPEWPLKDFASRAGRYATFKRTYSPPEDTWRERYADMMIAEPLTPSPEDYVVVSGSHLHRVLKNLRILHMFYAGFATNMCLQHRDYGMIAMSERGYNVVLLRDCTTALESHDTVDELLATKTFVWDIEHKYAFSTTSEDFVEACKRGR